MKAYQFHKSGKPEVLKMTEVEKPVPKPTEVLIKVESIGLNYAEILSRKGQYRWAPKRPYIPGMEAYGEVMEIGSQVTTRKVGDKVIIGKQYGCYAEYTCAEQHLCFSAFENFNAEENAAYLVNFMTAWVALKKLCRVEEGERVLIQAAAGGVGTAAVQVAKSLGCITYGTASKKEKLDLIEQLGARKGINYAIDDFSEVIVNDGGKVDCVLEVVGGEVFKKSVELLAPFGRIAVVGFASINLQKWNPFSWWKTWKDAPKAGIIEMSKNSYGLYASHIGYLTENQEIVGKIWQELKNHVSQHNLRPVIGKTFTFDKLQDAHSYMESRQSVGKIVITLNH